MIRFKQFITLGEWEGSHPNLRKVLRWLDDRWPNYSLTVTRIFNPPMDGESGVHRTTPHRAADVRTKDLGERNSEWSGKAMEELVNKNWDYGDGQHKVAFYHDNHLHVQVRDETTLRPEPL